MYLFFIASFILLFFRDEVDLLSGGYHPPIQDAHDWLRVLLLWRSDPGLTNLLYEVIASCD